MSSHDLWSEVRHPKPEDQPSPEKLRFLDPADRIGSEQSGEETLHRLAIASTVIGALSAVLCCAPILPMILGAAAIITGILAIRREHTEKERLARIGCTLGACALICGIVSQIVFPALFKLLSPLGEWLTP